jgi:hypothetical protein
MPPDGEGGVFLSWDDGHVVAGNKCVTRAGQGAIDCHARSCGAFHAPLLLTADADPVGDLNTALNTAESNATAVTGAPSASGGRDVCES